MELFLNIRLCKSNDASAVNSFYYPQPINPRSNAPQTPDALSGNVPPSRVKSANPPAVPPACVPRARHKIPRDNRAHNRPVGGRRPFPLAHCAGVRWPAFLARRRPSAPIRPARISRFSAGRQLGRAQLTTRPPRGAGPRRAFWTVSRITRRLSKGTCAGIIRALPRGNGRIMSD